MKHLSAAFRFVLMALVACAINQAAAAVTYSDAYADAGNLDSSVFSSDSGGAEGTQASASPGVMSHAEARAVPGSLSAASVARGAGAAQARAYSYWSDAFRPTAASHPAGTRGTLTAAVAVQGALLAEFVGRSNIDVYVVAKFWLDTQVDNGRHFVQGGGRLVGGYETGILSSGLQNFMLYFENVPFEFGREVGVTMDIFTIGGISIFGEGSGARVEANYGHTMTWAGVSDVRDGSGRLVQDFSALSTDSGFDFASADGGPTAVPEPASHALLVMGLLAAALGRRWSTRSCSPGRAGCPPVLAAGGRPRVQG